MKDKPLTFCSRKQQAGVRDFRVVDPTVEYARSGDVNIAYQVTGSGSLDLVLVSGFVSHLDNDWALPDSA